MVFGESFGILVSQTGPNTESIEGITICDKDDIRASAHTDVDIMVDITIGCPLHLAELVKNGKASLQFGRYFLYAIELSMFFKRLLCGVA